MIAIHEEIGVPARPERVWTIISDPYAVVPCVPGASIVRTNDDGTYDGQLSVKFGPARILFALRVVLELAPGTLAGRVFARGKESTGGTRMTSSTAFAVTPSPAGGSRVTFDGGVEVTGRLASLVETGASVVVTRLAVEFAANLSARCSDGSASANAVTSSAADSRKP
ncbi:MAG: SRPBCC family protein [Chloroflexi bacterium]|nr:SRPBCC family protein [Chloroflexota bacterium]